MGIQLFFILFVFYFRSFHAGSTSLVALPDDVHAHKIAFEILDLENSVILAQTCKPLRSILVEKYLQDLRREYPQLRNLDDLSEQEALFSVLVRPHRFDHPSNNHRIASRLPRDLVTTNPELFVNALLAQNGHRIFYNNDMIIFMLRLFGSLDPSQRTCINDSFIRDNLVKNLLPIIYKNPKIIREVATLYKCTRSNLPRVLYERGHFEFYPYNIFGNHLIRYYYTSVTLCCLFIFISILNGVQYYWCECIPFLVLLLLYYLSFYISEMIYNHTDLF